MELFVLVDFQHYIHTMSRTALFHLRTYLLFLLATMRAQCLRMMDGATQINSRVSWLNQLNPFILPRQLNRKVTLGLQVACLSRLAGHGMNQARLLHMQWHNLKECHLNGAMFSGLHPSVKSIGTGTAGAPLHPSPPRQCGCITCLTFGKRTTMKGGKSKDLRNIGLGTERVG